MIEEILLFVFLNGVVWFSWRQSFFGDYIALNTKFILTLDHFWSWRSWETLTRPIEVFHRLRCLKHLVWLNQRQRVSQCLNLIDFAVHNCGGALCGYW